MKRAILVAMIAAGCGQLNLDPKLPADARRYAVDLLGSGSVSVALDDSAGPFPEWVSASDFRMRLARAIDVSARYWGGRASDLSGWLVVLRSDDRVACRGASGTSGYGFRGCAYDGWIDISTQWTAGVEQTALIHEIGHALRGDGCHTDPRWDDFGPVANELESDGVRALASWWRERPSCGG